eukprot:5688124-Prorocentrum_lima.AAC.1
MSGLVRKAIHTKAPSMELRLEKSCWSWCSGLSSACLFLGEGSWLPGVVLPLQFMDELNLSKTSNAQAP